MSLILPSTNGKPVEIRPSKIIALGLNYLEHIKESQSVNVQNFTNEIPTEPVLFTKTPNVLIGPGEPVIVPAYSGNHGCSGWEMNFCQMICEIT